MCLFNTAFLSATHRVTVVDTGSLNAVHAGFKGVRISELRAAVGEDVFEYGIEFEGSHTFFQAVKHERGPSWLLSGLLCYPLLR